MYRDFISIDNPNIPILSPDCIGNRSYGKFIEGPAVPDDAVQKSLTELKVRDMYLPNFSAREFIGTSSKNIVFFNENGTGSELLGSCIFIKVNMKSKLPDVPKPIEAYHRTHNFKFDPNNEISHWVPANSPMHFIHFSYTTDYFNQFMVGNEPWAENLKEKISKKERVIGNKSLPISLLQDRALQNILDCPLTGKLGELLIETSIAQLIILQFNDYFNADATREKSNLSSRDREAIRELKDYLTVRFLDDHSMCSLSRHVGINSNKLMQLFKRAFGVSIFEYIAELRMEFAQRQLRNKDVRIIDVARMVGYKNPNHFSAAFKKRFGKVPSAFK